MWLDFPLECTRGSVTLSGVTAEWPDRSGSTGWPRQANQCGIGRLTTNLFGTSGRAQACRGLRMGAATISNEKWQNAKRTKALLRLLPEDFSRRKLRLFVCASVRRKMHPTIGSEAERLIHFGERIADDEPSVDVEEWILTHQNLCDGCQPGVTERQAFELSLLLGEDPFEEALWLLGQDPRAQPWWTERSNESPEDFSELLRDIFGNPFRPIRFNSSWLTPDALFLARQMYQSRDFSAMPILADALQDAGCENAEILDHCRGPGPHVRGCWVVDLVLEKA